jgi:hypothetical protein
VDLSGHGIIGQVQGVWSTAQKGQRMEVKRAKSCRLTEKPHGLFVGAVIAALRPRRVGAARVRGGESERKGLPLWGH